MIGGHSFGLETGVIVVAMDVEYEMAVSCSIETVKHGEPRFD
jgi:hypothetical protein